MPVSVLITGLAGAGKSTALRALEDGGYYCIDNLPVGLLDALLNRPPVAGDQPLALVMDLRDPGFGVEVLDRLGARILFLEAEGGVLIRRFQESRRPHWLGGGRLADGIAAERRMLAPVRERADHVIDTSCLSPHQLKAMVLSLVGGEGEVAVWITSFGFKYGLPPEADMVLDVRFLPNPHFVADLRPLTGREPVVADYVFQGETASRFFERLLPLLEFLLPQYQREGKSYFTLAVGCTGGRHRSVAVAERLATLLAERGIAARVFHRQLAESM